MIKKLLLLYEKQQIYRTIFQYAFVGYIVIPFSTMVIINLPLWYFFI